MTAGQMHNARISIQFCGMDGADDDSPNENGSVDGDPPTSDGNDGDGDDFDPNNGDGDDFDPNNGDGDFDGDNSNGDGGDLDGDLDSEEGDPTDPCSENAEHHVRYEESCDGEICKLINLCTQTVEGTRPDEEEPPPRDREEVECEVDEACQPSDQPGVDICKVFDKRGLPVGVYYSTQECFVVCGAGGPRLDCRRQPSSEGWK